MKFVMFSALGGVMIGLLGCDVELPEVVEPDCDGRVMYYADADGDGWADGATGTLACEPVDGNLSEDSSSGWDCDDADPDRAEDCTPGGGLDTSDTGSDTGDTGDGGR